MNERAFDIPEFLAGYIRGYSHGVEHRVNPPSPADRASGEALGEIGYVKWSEIRAKHTPPGGTAAEMPATPLLAEGHASVPAAPLRSAPGHPPQVAPSSGTPLAPGQAAEWGEGVPVSSDDITAAMESAVLAVIQVLREHEMPIAASLCQRALDRLNGKAFG